MLVSIIMPTYNCARFIGQAIYSVFAQTHSEWELLVVDDHSTDNTRQVLWPYLQKYPHIHHIVLPKHSGPAAARTEGLRQAKGDYIAFLDSDDAWYPHKLAKQIAFMQRTGAAFSCTGYDQMDEGGMRNGKALIPPAETDYTKMLRLACPVGNLTVMYDRRVLGDQTVPDIKKRNDFALWLQLLRQTPLCYGMPDILATYRIRKQSLSHNKLSLIGYQWQLYHRIEKLNIFKSVWYLCCWMWCKVTGLGVKKVRFYNKVCICGHFGFNKELLNGQTIKTRTLARTLQEQMGPQAVCCVDTHGGLLAFPRVLIQLIKGFFCCPERKLQTFGRT